MTKFRYRVHDIVAPFGLLDTCSRYEVGGETKTANEKAALTADIKEHGLRDPIVLFEGKILDGANRYICAKAAGYTFTDDDFVVFGGTWNEAVAFCMSKNIYRRHLTATERAMYVVQLNAMLRPEEDTHRQVSARGQADDRRSPITLTTLAEIAEVSRDTVTRVAAVSRKAEPEVKDAMKRGEVNVGAAEKLAELSPEEQRRVVAAGKNSVRRAVAEANEKRRARSKADKPKPDLFTRLDAILTELGSFVVDLEAERPTGETADRLRFVAGQMRARIDTVEALLTPVTDDSLRKLLDG